MHEISLIRSVFNTIEAEFTSEDLERLEAIDLKIGVLSNIQPVLMQNAFDAVRAAEQKFPQVKLNVVSVPVEIYCASCKLNSLVQNYVFKCEHCGQPNNHIIRGEELLIHQLHFED